MTTPRNFATPRKTQHALTQVKSIVSLRRGIEVLCYLEGRFVSTLKEIHDATGVPKASLLRILKTLEGSGRVARRIADGAYMPRPANQNLDAVLLQRLRLVQAAAPVLLSLKTDMPWPSDIAVRDGLDMMTLESNDTRGELEVNRRIISYRPDMLHSAMGRAHLAFCDEAEHSDLLAQLACSAGGLPRPAHLERIIAETRARGYSIRDPASIGPAGDEAHAQSAIALPIFAQGRLIACLNCVWLAESMLINIVVRRYLPRLQRAAQDTGAAWTRINSSEN